MPDIQAESNIVLIYDPLALSRKIQLKRIQMQKRSTEKLHIFQPITEQQDCRAVIDFKCEQFF